MSMPSHEYRHFAFSLRERRLVWMTPPVEVPKPLAERIVESLDDPAEKLKMLMEEFQKKEDGEQQKILQTISEQLLTVDNRPEVQGHILENLRHLEAQASVLRTKVDLSAFRASLEKLRNRVAKGEITKGATASAGEGRRITVREWFGDKWAGAKDWSKENLDVTKWSEGKKATVATLTLGAAALLSIFAWLRSRKNAQKKTAQLENASQNADEPKRKFSLLKALLWVPVIGLAGYGLYKGAKWIDAKTQVLTGVQEQFGEWRKRGEEQIAEWTKASERKFEEWRGKATDVPKQNEDHTDENSGFTKRQVEEAEEMYSYMPPEVARPRIMEHFGVQEGEDNPEFERVWKTLETKYTLPEPENGIHYVDAEWAMKNYERGVEYTVLSVEQMARAYSLELTFAAAIATRLGVLHAVASGSGTALEKAASLGQKLTQWGIRHPFASLSLLGAGFMGIRQLKTGARLPLNLNELSVACMNVDAPLFKGVLEKAGIAAVKKLKLAMQAIGPIGKDLGEWISEQTERLFDAVQEAIPDMVTLDEGEIIERNTVAAITQLSNTLISRRLNALQKGNKKDLAHKCDIAREKLLYFQFEFLRPRCTEVLQEDHAAEALETLKGALVAVGITLQEADDIIHWKLEGQPEGGDLCVSPTVKDKNQIKLLSQKLRTGESNPTFLVWNALEQLRERIGQNVEFRGGGLPGILFGNTLYIVERAGTETARYIAVPFDIASDVLGFGPLFFEESRSDMSRSRNGLEKAQNFTAAGITCTLISIPAMMVGKLKRFAIGGGPWVRPKGLRVVGYMTPVVSHGLALKNLHDTYNDAKMIRKFGWFKGRSLNNVIYGIHFRPEDAARIMTTRDTRVLESIANRVKITLSGDIEMMRQHLYEAIIRKIWNIEEVNISEIPKRLRAAGWDVSEWKKAFSPHELGNAKHLFDIMAAGWGDARELLDSGQYTVQQLVELGMDIQKLRAAGVSLQELAQAGVTAEAFQRAGVTVEELQGEGVERADPGKTPKGTKGGSSKVSDTGAHEQAKADANAAPREAEPGKVAQENPLEARAEAQSNEGVKRQPPNDGASPAKTKPSSGPEGGRGGATTKTEVASPGKNRITGGDGASTKPYASPTEGQLRPSMDTQPHGEVEGVKAPKNVSPETLRMIDEVADGNARTRAAILRYCESLGSADEAAEAVSDIQRVSAQGVKASGLITQPEHVRSFIQSVAKSSDPMEAAAKLGKLAHALNAVGIVGDVIGMAYAGYEMYLTGKLREQTPEEREKLRALYFRRYYYHGAEMAVGVVGFGAGATAIGASLLGATGVAAATGPVALATLPVSAAIGIGYQWHKWEEDQERTAEDFRREMGPEERTVDVREQGFGETIGRTADVGLGDGRWKQVALMLLPQSIMTGQTIPIAANYAGTMHKSLLRVGLSAREVNRKKIEAIVLHTTTVQLPKVRTESVEKALNVYLDAKVDYILKFGKGNTETAIHPHMDLAALFMQADAYARRQHDKYMAGEALQSFPAKSTTEQKLALEHIDRMRRESLQGVLALPLAILSQSPEQAESLRPQLEEAFYGVLMHEAQPYIFDFTVRSQEENFRDEFYRLGLDGDASRVVTMHIMDRLKDVVDREKQRLAEVSLLAIREHPAQELDQQIIHSVVAKVKKSLGISQKALIETMRGRIEMRDGVRRHQYAREIWEELTEDKGRYGRIRAIEAKQDELVALQSKNEGYKRDLIPDSHVDSQAWQQQKLRGFIAENEKQQRAIRQWLEKNSL